MSSIVTTRGYVERTEKFYKKYYIQVFAKHIEYVIDEIKTLINLKNDPHMENTLIYAVRNTLENYKQELAGLLPYFLNNGVEFDNRFTDLINRVNNHIAKYKILVRQVNSIYSIHGDNKKVLYQSLLELQDLPEEVRKYIEGELDKIIREFEKSISEELEKKLKEYSEKLMETKPIQKEKKDTLKETKEKVKNFAKFIESIDKDYYQEHISNLVERVEKASGVQEVELLFDEIKLRYLKLKKEKIESEVYREEINRILEQVKSEEHRREIERILSQRVITKEDYSRALKIHAESMLEEAKKPKMEAKNVLDTLSKLGYNIITQDNYGVFYFDTPYGEEYKVRLKFEGDGFTIQFVRIIDVEEKELSEYEREVDMRKAKEFCKSLDSIFEYLEREYGIMLDITRRIEPEERMFYIKMQDLPEAVKEKKKEDIKHYRRMSL
ncbi:MAG: hypothetical protein QXI85_03355 [Desulfurococcaceae archaeon]